MRRLAASAVTLVVFSVVVAVPMASAQYPPSPTPSPTVSPAPGPVPTPTDRPGRPRPTTPADGGTPPGSPTARPTPPATVPPINPAPGPAGPGPVDPGVAPTTQLPDPGESITISGSGWLPNSLVEIYIQSTPRLLGRTTSDANGFYSLTVTIPADMEVGSHTLVAQGVAADGSPRTVSTPIFVGGTISSAGAHTGSGSSAPGMANTGIDVTGGLLVAALLLAAGSLFLITARRRGAASQVVEASD